MLDRLQNPGFDHGPLPYLPGVAIRGESLHRDGLLRRRLVEGTVGFHSGLDASITAPTPAQR